jgi:hypothetical protein
MMRQFTPPGLHLSGPRLPMGMSLIYYDAQIGITVRKRPKQTKPAVKMNSEHRKKLKMTLFSPKTVKCSPMQLHFPQGPDGSSSFSEVKMAERHLCWLCNLFQSLQNAENTRNQPKFRPKRFCQEEVMTKRSFVPFSKKKLHQIWSNGS